MARVSTSELVFNAFCTYYLAQMANRLKEIPQHWRSGKTCDQVASKQQDECDEYDEIFCHYKFQSGSDLKGGSLTVGVPIWCRFWGRNQWPFQLSLGLWPLLAVGLFSALFFTTHFYSWEAVPDPNLQPHISLTSDLHSLNVSASIGYNFHCFLHLVLWHKIPFCRISK